MLKISSTLLGMVLLCLIPTALMSTGLMFPLYIYPGSKWNTLISAKNAYPNVPVIAIINPNSGPGTAIDSTYVTKINQLIAANITVIGYDHTSWGARNASDVKNDIDLYKSFYPNIQGIFFDEMTAESGDEAYYSEMTAYARSKGFNLTVGNPGMNIDSSYVGTEDILVIYESNGYADLSQSSTWPTSDPSQLAIMSIKVSSLNTTWVTQACQKVGWLFVTNDKLPNPYDTLPTYLTTLMQTLSTCN